MDLKRHFFKKDTQMINKLTKELQIKTTTRYLLTPIRIASTKKKKKKERRKEGEKERKRK